jgi:hypothetical protein
MSGGPNPFLLRPFYFRTGVRRPCARRHMQPVRAPLGPTRAKPGRPERDLGLTAADEPTPGKGGGLDGFFDPARVHLAITETIPACIDGNFDDFFSRQPPALTTGLTTPACQDTLASVGAHSVPDSLQSAIERQRQILKGWLSSSLGILTEACREAWPDRSRLEACLAEGLNELPYCKYLYVLDAEGRQITSNFSRKGALPEHFGRDRSGRPYLSEALAGADASLSEAYLSRNARRPTLTAIQRIRSTDGRTLGFLGADFDLRELPATQALYRQPGQWVQLKGDPAIRAGLFHQVRNDSPMDLHIDAVLDLMNELVTVHGVYHAKLHFSSSRATLWVMNDPYRYRLHGIDELSDPNVLIAYPPSPYPDKAVIPADRVRDVLHTFKSLRFMDETVYLRSGSLNIFNGLIGLTFSCDGSHYMPWDEFLDKNVGFWLGGSAGT